jgi:hypothetical protein
VLALNAVAIVCRNERAELAAQTPQDVDRAASSACQLPCAEPAHRLDR